MLPGKSGSIESGNIQGPSEAHPKGWADGALCIITPVCDLAHPWGTPMKVFRNVCTYIWNDDKFPFASDDCQLVWFHLFTNPLSSPLGVYRASVAGLAEDKNRNDSWSLERYRKAFDECLRLGFIVHDPKALLIGFPKYFSPDHLCNKPGNPNVVKGWGKRFNDLPESHLKLYCYQSLEIFLKAFDKAFMEAFHVAFKEPLGKEPRIPEALNLKPEALNLKPELKENTSPADKKISAGKVEAIGAATWEAYRAAYQQRYKVDPVRNHRINSMLKELVEKILSATEAPQVAAFYLTCSQPIYLNSRHSVNLLIRDATGLRTQWATGIKVTTSESKNAEVLDNAREQIKRVEANIHARKGSPL